MSKPVPPKKQDGQARGPRRVIGELSFDIPEAARLTGITPKGIRARIERRQFPFRRVGGRILVVRAELERWLLAQDGCGVDEALRNEALRKGGKESSA